MTLVGRNSAFFLAVLAAALIAFSAALLFLASWELQHEIDQQLEAGLDTLAAAAEGKPLGFTWEPDEHRFTLGIGGRPGDLRWTVADGDGRFITRSENLQHTEADALADALREDGLSSTVDETQWNTAAVAGESWRILSRRLQTGSLTSPLIRPNQRVLYPTLVLTAGLSSQPLQQKLRQLLLALATISAGVWIGTALLGRWLGRRALAPLTRMATAVQGMAATSLDQRLPLPDTRDELQGMGVAFNGLLDRVQDVVERQRSFTSEASHQLRTPLTAMLGQIEVTLERQRTADEYREALERMTRPTRRLVQVVEMLLFLSRADAEAELRELEATDLRDWVRGQMALWPSERSKDAITQMPDDPVPVRIQPILLGQLLDNLLDNAAKYSRPATPIMVRVARSNRHAVLEVEDQGIGIAPGDLEHVFEPFFRGEETSRLGIDGVGLGLALVKRIAGAHRGTVSARSEVEKGTTLRVELPLPPIAVSESSSAGMTTAGR